MAEKIEIGSHRVCGGVFLVLASKPYRVLLWVLTFFVTAWVGSQVTFLFQPFVIVSNVLLLPLVLAFVLYYLIAPIVKFLEGRRVPRTLAILGVFLVLLLGGGLLVVTIGNAAYWQLLDLIERFPAYLQQLQDAAGRVQLPAIFESFGIEERFSLEQIIEWFTDWALGVLPTVGASVGTVANIATSAALSLILLPVVLYYLLKEREHILGHLLQLVPDRFQPIVKSTAKDIDRGLASFIQGQLLVSFSVGFMMYIGLLIVGIEHALVLSLIGLFTNLIPYLGPILGAIPALIVGFVSAPILGAKVLLVVVIVQQLESFVITPQVMGRKLAAHPLAIILSLIIIGSLIGIVGLFLAMPIFVVLKIILGHALVSYRKAVNMDRHGDPDPT